MDCGDLGLPKGTICDFSGLQSVRIEKEGSKRELKELLQGAQTRIARRVDGLLEQNRDRIEAAQGRIDEIKAMLESCDESCIASYLRRYFEKRMKINRAGKPIVEDFLESELTKYLDAHPRVKQELQKWYDVYNHGDYSKREVLKLLPPILGAIENRAGVHFGFIPLKGGFVSLMRNADGSFYALMGDTVSSGSTIEKAIAPFATNTTILQVIDKEGRAIGTIETPHSRALDGLLFIEKNHSVWSLLAKDMGKALDIRYHQDGHKIHLRTPREGFQVQFTEGRDTIAGVGEVSAKHLGVGYHLRTGFSESTVSIGRGTLQGNGYLASGIQGSLANHLDFGKLFSRDSLGIHGVGNWDLKIQGPFKKPDTAKLEGSQAIAFAGDSFYVGYGRSVRWSPEILDKKYYHFEKEPLFIGGIKRGNMHLDASHSPGVTRLEIREVANSSSLRAMIEYQKRANTLLSAPKLRAELSYMLQF